MKQQIQRAGDFVRCARPRRRGLRTGHRPTKGSRDISEVEKTFVHDSEDDYSHHSNLVTGREQEMRKVSPHRSYSPASSIEESSSVAIENMEASLSPQYRRNQSIFNRMSVIGLSSIPLYPSSPSRRQKRSRVAPSQTSFRSSTRRRESLYLQQDRSSVTIRSETIETPLGFMESYSSCVKQQTQCFLHRNWWNTMFHSIISSDLWPSLFFVFAFTFWLSLYRVYIKPAILHIWSHSARHVLTAMKSQWLRIRVGKDRDRIMFAIGIMLLQIRRREQITQMCLKYHEKHIRKRPLLRKKAQDIPQG